MFKRQAFALAFALPAMLVAIAMDYRRLERLANPIFVGSLLLLASTLALAPITRGNRSWLICGPFSLQPAELAKIGLIIALARWFQRHPPGRIHRLRDLASRPR